jgi:hypothetical protein
MRLTGRLGTMLRVLYVINRSDEIVGRDGLGGVYTDGETSGFNEELKNGLCTLAEGSSVTTMGAGAGVTL